jgi:hypothetical protein
MTQSPKPHSTKSQSAKPQSATLGVRSSFGHRHHRPAPRAGGPASAGRRFDWPLVALVTVVFVAGFVWLF